MKKYNFSIYLDTGEGYQLITEDNCIKKVGSANVSRDKNEMYYRIKLGEITFQNIPEYNIYDIIDSVTFTTEIKIKIVYGSLTVEGYFAKIDCSFDDDKNGKIIIAKPAIQDQYRLFLENYETEIDVAKGSYTYETGSIQTINESLIVWTYWFKGSTRQTYGKKKLKNSDYEVLNDPGIKDFAGFFNANQSPNITRLGSDPYNATDENGFSLQDVVNDIDTLLPLSGGWELCEVTIWEGSKYRNAVLTKMRYFYVTCKFASERVFVPTSDGTQYGDLVYPAEDEGWEALSDEPVFEPQSRGIYGYYFGRPPFNGAYADNFWELQPTETNDGNGGGASFYWNYSKTTKINYPGSAEDDGITTLNSLIGFKDFLTYMYRQMHPDLSTKEVKSLFFFNDDEGSFDFMAGLTGCNYVTTEPNELNYLKTFHTYTLKTNIDESGEDEDSSLIITFKKMLDDLQKLFPVKIYVDESLNLWIEHVKFFELQKSTIEVYDRPELVNTKRFEFDTSELFDKKTINQINSGSEDFTKNTMKFEQAVSNNRNKDLLLEVTTELFTTDLGHCLRNPNDLTNGLVLVLSKDGKIINDTGLVSGEEKENGALSLSQLLVKYWTYEGVWVEGQINDEDYKFNNPLRSKVGKEEIMFRGVEPSLYYTTPIGVGLIDDATIDLTNETTSAKLRYRYNSNIIGDQEQFLVYAEDGLYNFGNTDY